MTLFSLDVGGQHPTLGILRLCDKPSPLMVETCNPSAEARLSERPPWPDLFLVPI